MACTRLLQRLTREGRAHPRPTQRLSSPVAKLLQWSTSWNKNVIKRGNSRPMLHWGRHAGTNVQSLLLDKLASAECHLSCGSCLARGQGWLQTQQKQQFP